MVSWRWLHSRYQPERGTDQLSTHAVIMLERRHARRRTLTALTGLRPQSQSAVKTHINKLECNQIKHVTIQSLGQTLMWIVSESDPMFEGGMMMTFMPYPLFISFYFIHVWSDEKDCVLLFGTHGTGKCCKPVLGETPHFGPAVKHNSSPGHLPFVAFESNLRPVWEACPALPPGLNNVNINLLPSWCVWGIICIDSWKKGNAKECSDYWKIALSSHSSKVMLKILQVRLQQYVNWELPDVQVGFRKGRGTRDQIANICWIIEKARKFQKII